MKFYVTKYALTAGIQKVEAEYPDDGLLDVGTGTYYHREGREWHCTRAAAISRAEEMRLAKIKSHKKAIAKLEKMTFEVRS